MKESAQSAGSLPPTACPKIHNDRTKTYFKEAKKKWLHTVSCHITLEYAGTLVTFRAGIQTL